MDQIQSTQNVSFQAQMPKTATTQPQTAAKPPEIKDGDNKTMQYLTYAGGALAGAAIIFGAVKLIKGKGGLKIKPDADTAKKLTKKQAQEASLKPVKDVSTKAQTEITDLKKGLEVLKEQKATYAAQESCVKAAKAKMDDLDKQFATLTTQITDLNSQIEAATDVAQKTKLQGELEKANKSLNKVKGHLGNAKCEYSKANAALKKMPEIKDSDIQEAGKAISEAAKKSPEGTAVVQMQRYKRKHPEISDETAKRIYDSAMPPKTKAAAQSSSYDKYLDFCEKTKKRDIMPKDEFLRAQQKREYAKYKANFKPDDKMRSPISFEQFLKQNYT